MRCEPVAGLLFHPDLDTIGGQSVFLAPAAPYNTRKKLESCTGMGITVFPR